MSEISLITHPKKDKLFDYLSNFFQLLNYENIQELEKTEKSIQERLLITHDNSLRLMCWKEYLKFIRKKFKKDNFRSFLFYESFTKITHNESEFKCSEIALEIWMTYIDLCCDGKEVLNFMIKNEICTSQAKFTYFHCIILEQAHKFEQANEVFLEALRKKCDSTELLNLYQTFETRMEERLNRILGDSRISSDIINLHIQKEINKNQNSLSNNINKFFIQSNKFHFVKNPQISSVKYGEIPVYIDSENRKKLLTKGTQIIEIFKILDKFLIEKDQEYFLKSKNFDEEYEKNNSKKPFSWLNSLRFISTKLNEEKSMQEIIFKKEEIVKIKEIKNDLKADSQNLKFIDFQKNIQPNEQIKIPANSSLKNDILSMKDIKPIDEEDENFKIKFVKIEKKNEKKLKFSFNLDEIKDNKTERYRNALYTNVINFKKFEENELKKKIEEEKKFKENLKRRKTLVYQVDSDGDIVMSSDNEKAGNDIFPNGDLNFSRRKRELDDSSINLWQSIENQREKLLERINQLQSFLEKNAISQVQKNNLYDEIEEIEKTLKNLEEQQRKYDLKKSEKEQLQKKCEVAKIKETSQLQIPTQIKNNTNHNNLANQPIFHRKENDLSSKIGNHQVKTFETIQPILKKNNEDKYSSNVTRSIDFTNMSFDEESAKKTRRPIFYEKIFSNIKDEKNETRSDLNLFQRIHESDSEKKNPVNSHSKNIFLNYLLNQANGSLHKSNSNNNSFLRETEINLKGNYFEDNVIPMKTIVSNNANPCFFKSYDFEEVNHKSSNQNLESLFGIKNENQQKKNFMFNLSNITEKQDSLTSERSINL